MKSHLVGLASALALSGLVACGDKGTGSSGTASAAPSASAASTAGAGGTTKPGGKLVHVKRSMEECTFDFDVPEEMKETEKDGLSFTLESESFAFTGFVGQSLSSEPKHAFQMIQDKDKFKDVHRGTDTGTMLAIMTEKEPTKDAKDKHAISGMGSEPYSNERSLGCSFSCDGVRAKEADVVAFCKSVKITVDKSKIKKEE